jgi:hypothetical protein
MHAVTTTATMAQLNGMRGGRAGLSKSSRRTLDALYAHPLANNLEWTHIIALFREIGSVEHRPNGETAIVLGAEQEMLRRPHSKDLTLDEVVEIRHFLTRVGVPPQPANDTGDFLVAVEDHDARVYHLDLGAADPSSHIIKPYDPHHVQRHLAPMGQDRAYERQSPEDATSYERIAQAVAAAVPSGRIVVVGLGKGQSYAAHHLIAWLRLHHHDIAQCLVGEVTADLSSATPAQLLDLAREALAAPPE